MGTEYSVLKLGNQAYPVCDSKARKSLSEKRDAPDYRVLRRVCDIWTWARVAADPSEGLVETPEAFLAAANMANAAYPEFNEVSSDWWYAGIYWPNGRFRYEATSGLAGSATTANLVYAFVSYDEEGHEIERFRAKATRDPSKVDDRSIEPPDAYGGNAFARIATTDIVHYMDSVVLAKAEEEISGKYTKPDTGIPKNDLASDVQTSLNKADTALQEHQDISGKADKSDTYTKGETDAAITANVENVLTSVSATHALSANMGRTLQEQIDNLEQRGRYLSVWNCTTGLAKTEPPVNPYEYKSGDYFIVGTVGTENYRPSGTRYDKDSPSRVRETDEVLVNDTYYYDGTNWSLLHTEQPSLSWGSIVGDIGDQEDLSEALEGKLDKSDVIKQSAVTDSTPDGKAADAKDIKTALASKVGTVNGVAPTNGNVDVKRVYNDNKDEMIDGSGNVYVADVPGDIFVASNGDKYIYTRTLNGIHYYTLSTAIGTYPRLRVEEGGTTVYRETSISVYSHDIPKPFYRRLSDGIEFAAPEIGSTVTVTYHADASFDPVARTTLLRKSELTAPSTATSAQNKPADAKATGDAIAGKANVSDFALSAMASYVASLFSTAPSVPKPTPTGRLNNAELESSIMAVAGSGGDTTYCLKYDPENDVLYYDDGEPETSNQGE